MPTFRHGRDAYFAIDDSGGTLRNITSMLREANHSRTVDTAETSAFGTFDKTFVVGMREGRLTIGGMFSASASTDVDPVLAGILGQAASVTFEYGPEGNTTGRTRYTGECYLTSYEINAAIGDMVSLSAEFQVTGAVTRNTFP
jgi:hypothetical protein